MSESYLGPEQGRLLRSIAAGTAVVGLVAGAEFVHHTIDSHSPTVCAAPTAASLAAANTLEQVPLDSYHITAGNQLPIQQKTSVADIAAEDRKTNPTLSSQQLETKAYEQFDTSLAGYAGSGTYAWLFRDHVAEETGVTLHDPRSFSVPLEWALQYDPQMPFSEYLSTAQAYAKEFGVTVELAGEDPNAAGLPSDMKAPTLEGLNNVTAKKDVV